MIVNWFFEACLPPDEEQNSMHVYGVAQAFQKLKAFHRLNGECHLLVARFRISRFVCTMVITDLLLRGFFHLLFNLLIWSIFHSLVKILDQKTAGSLFVSVTPSYILFCTRFRLISAGNRQSHSSGQWSGHSDWRLWLCALPALGGRAFGAHGLSIAWCIGWSECRRDRLAEWAGQVWIDEFTSGKRVWGRCHASTAVAGSGCAVCN